MEKKSQKESKNINLVEVKRRTEAGESTVWKEGGKFGQQVLKYS
jgi:hypothetical protein